MEKVLEILQKKEALIAIAALLLLIVIWIISRGHKVKNMKKQLAEFEVRYNSLKSVPLLFKLNKAIAMAKVNKDYTEKVEECQTDFDSSEANLKQVYDLISETDDLLSNKKLKAAKNNLLDIQAMLENGDKQTFKLDALLETLLEQETKQREEITVLKEKFRKLKTKVKSKSTELNYCNDAIEKNISEIEKKFSAFEEWMYGSEFQKAKEELIDIQQSMDNLERRVAELPELIQVARGVIPGLIDEVSRNYAITKQKGVYLNHLDVSRNVELISEAQKNDLFNLKSGITDGIKDHLDSYKTRLAQMDAQIEKESKAYDELKSTNKQCQESLDELRRCTEYVKKNYKQVQMRFGFEDISSQLEENDKKIALYVATKLKMDKVIEENASASTITLVNIKELTQNVKLQSEEMSAIQKKLDSVRSDEERGKTQLLKLYLILNEIQIKIRKYRLPSISNTYEEDLQKSSEYVHEIEAILAETPLNVKLLNATLQDAIDYIYKLYNNVNNIVGTAIMVEDTIVFGNKYRSTYSEVDSELTRAELCFRNGEYTQALTIAIAAIEKIHPGSYERMIKENAKSAA